MVKHTLRFSFGSPVCTLTCSHQSYIIFIPSLLPLSASNSLQSVLCASIRLPLLFFSLSVRTDLIYNNMLTTISAEYGIKASVNMKEQRETEGEWECAPTIQRFIKMSNTKDYRKRDITSTKSILL